jgi:hypothetical protein
LRIKNVVSALIERLRSSHLLQRVCGFNQQPPTEPEGFDEDHYIRAAQMNLQEYRGTEDGHDSEQMFLNSY